MHGNMKLDFGIVVGGSHPDNIGLTGGNHPKIAFPASAPTPGLHSQLGLHNMAYSPGWQDLQFEHSFVQQMAVCLTTGDDGNKSPGIALGFACAFNNPPAAGGGFDVTSAQTAAGVSLPGYNEPLLGPDYQPTPFVGNPPVPHQRDEVVVLWPDDSQPLTSSINENTPWYGRPYHQMFKQPRKPNVYTAKSDSSSVPPARPPTEIA